MLVLEVADFCPRFLSYELQIIRKYYLDSLKAVKGIGSKTLFYRLISFNRFKSELPDTFYCLTTFKLVFETQEVEAGECKRLFMEGAN